ncbi:MAG: hypothetical protein M3Y27_29790 [Acidobacteriota bacterium]|nr:hypothetical protein [Acidobacteriota bacterium]
MIHNRERQTFRLTVQKILKLITLQAGKLPVPVFGHQIMTDPADVSCLVLAFHFRL